MKVIARYSGFKVVDIPNNLSLTEDDIMDYLYGLDVQCDEVETKRNCHKCVYEVGCTDNPVGCKRYKRDAPDGGYYG